MNIANKLIELAEIDREIQKNAFLPSILLQWQNKKLEFIVENLVSSEENCLVLPVFLMGRFKTIGYYGERQPLVRALYYFHHSEGDTIPFQMPVGNLVKFCGNPDCLNMNHVTTRAELRFRELELMKLKNKGIRTRKENKIKEVAKEFMELTEEEMREEVRKIEEEIFKEFGNKEE
jgi:hypothetical protein